ncbi:MAG: Txe/YoeB family addiction module toxin [Acidobacteriota bacterium]|nr:Txe/YoeB family addiction module toxin [Acidobacteriota bacterium]
MEEVGFLPQAFDDMNYWAATDRNLLLKIFELIKDIKRSPFSGIGKPEPLKHQLKGLWSRRITQEHRLIYRVDKEELIIVSCRFHYSK